MSNTLRLVLVFHNHQPVGNFDGVFEEAYQKSYKPFLDVFEPFSSLRMALHTSGSLAEWLQAHHPEYLDRLAALAAAQRVEVIGGAFYEPILTMVPRRDRIGQICAYSQWLKQRLGVTVHGAWIPERVWEQSLVSDLAAAGIRYTLLDDFHFRNVGLCGSQLHGYYVTEDEGQLVAVFPGSERLRYTVPFADPEVTLGYLRDIAQHRSGAVIAFGDDGEKFGVWPETHKHVYQDGWLHRFFQALEANADWLCVTTPAESVEQIPPLGKIYLPDSSYREMTEWALPAERIVELDRVKHDLEGDPRWPVLAPYLRGGYWRNFKVKYPEADEMYARMLRVSHRLQAAGEAGHDFDLVEAARGELYRGQCNCGYWHGAFGGIYLPHLRHAVYRHLIEADNLLDRAAGRCEPWVEAAAGDFNLDARQEVELGNNRLIVLLSPYRGGQMYELDVKSIGLNLLATMTRRPEAYHRRLLAERPDSNGQVASIHERVVFKQPDLDQQLQYDSYPRKSLLDHFFDPQTTLAAVAAGQAEERGDFLHGTYEARLRRNPDRIQVQLSRQGWAAGEAVRVTKGVTLEAASHELELAYLLEGLPAHRPLLFAVELQFAGLPAGLDDRYFRDASGGRIGTLGRRLDLTEATSLSLVDEWLGIEASLYLSRAGGIWTFPIETVSQSEGGFELVHQSVAVFPHWLITADSRGRFSVTMRISLDTRSAAARRDQAALAATL